MLENLVPPALLGDHLHGSRTGRRSHLPQKRAHNPRSYPELVTHPASTATPRPGTMALQPSIPASRGPTQETLRIGCNRYGPTEHTADHGAEVSRGPLTA